MKINFLCIFIKINKCDADRPKIALALMVHHSGEKDCCKSDGWTRKFTWLSCTPQKIREVQNLNVPRNVVYDMNG